MKTALIAISIPGKFDDDDDMSMHFTDHPLLAWLTSLLTKYNIEWQKVDTNLGWGNLNQDWIEFTTEIDTSWSWCKLNILTEKESKILFALLQRGELLMTVHYREKGELRPHA